MRRKGRKICILLCLERTWERGCDLEYSIDGKELGSILIKNFYSGAQIQKGADSYADFTGYVWTEAVSGKINLRIQKYLDTCGRGLKLHPKFPRARVKQAKQTHVKFATFA